MRSLVVQVLSSSRGVVEIPSSIEIVQLRCPDAAASQRVGIRVDYLGLGRLEPLDGLSTRELEVLPFRRDEVIVPIEVGHLGVTTTRVSDRVREGSDGVHQRKQGHGGLEEIAKGHDEQNLPLTESIFVSGLFPLDPPATYKTFQSWSDPFSRPLLYHRGRSRSETGS